MKDQNARLLRANNNKIRRVAKSVAIALACLPAFHSLAQEEDDSKLEVIEITAQKRVQSVMEVPITVGIVSNSLLEQSTSISMGDITKFIPGFDINDDSTTQSSIQIRGIGSPNISVGGDPSSATFFDDVYMPRAAQNVLFSDLQRIEVLKGPQGTLFGRNAALGVVNVIPNKPSDLTEGFAKISIGTDQLVRVEGMANFALSEKVFLRINALSSQQDGFIKNSSNPAWNRGTEVFDLGERGHSAARISLLWEASDSTEVQFSYDYDDLKQAPPMAIGLSEFAFGGGTDPFADTVENDVRNGVEARDMQAYTLKVEHEFNDAMSMKYVASYRDWETVNREDEDGTGDITRYFDTANNEDSNIFYNELQFNYVNDRISAVAGFSYSKEEVSQQTELNITADTIARLTTGSLNEQVRAGVAQAVSAQFGGMTDDATIASVFGPGATFDSVVNGLFAQQGFPIDHIWNPDEWASALTALGAAGPILDALGMSGGTLTGAIVTLGGDLTYDAVAQSLGVPEIFGPSNSGRFWQENIFNTGDFTNWGVFADVDFAVTDKWHVIAGLRYSNDDKDFTWRIPPTTFTEFRPGVSNQLFPVTDLAASDSWSKVTGRLVTNYQFSDDQMVFASYSTGYKSGGFDSLVPIDQSAGQSAFAPEDVTNIEFGYKAVLWDQLIANVSVYQMELDNLQVSIESRMPGSNQAVPAIINENREINGFEFDLRWSVSDTFTLGLVTDIRETDVDTPSFFDSNGDMIAARSRSFDADTNYTISADWTPDFDFALVTLHMDYAFVENTNDQRADIQAFELALPAYLSDRKDLNARVSFANSDETIELSFWARNLLDERYIETIGNRTTATLGTPFARVNRGREVGMEFKMSF